MLRRHGPAVAATLTLAALLAALVLSAVSPSDESTALPRVVTAEPRTTRIDVKAGEPVWFTWAGTFALAGDARAIVTGMELLKVHPGLNVRKVQAVNRNNGAPAAQRYWTGSLPSAFNPKALVPITTVVLEPGETNESTYFIAEVAASKPGIYRLEGWRLRYRAGNLDGESTYEARLEIHVT